MTTRRAHEGSLRPGRLEFSSLALAVVISLAIHGGGYGVYKVGQYFHLWQQLRLPGWLAETKMLSAPPKEQKNRSDETPLIFVDVNPQVATTEPPKDTKYYSNKNSQAASTEADEETGVPKITGTQTEIVKAEDVQRSPFDRLQPALPRADRDQQAEQAKPKTPAPPGDLTMAKPEADVRQDTGTAERSKPRTLKEVMRENRNQLAGQKMKQDGGRLRAQMTSLDAKATAFGDYDARFIEAIEQRWFDLLDTQSYYGYRRGRVVVQFRLKYDGDITDMKIIEDTVGVQLSILCQKAVVDPKPFEKWSREMRLMVDKDYREILFTFFYN